MATKGWQPVSEKYGVAQAAQGWVLQVERYASREAYRVRARSEQGTHFLAFDPTRDAEQVIAYSYPDPDKAISEEALKNVVGNAVFDVMKRMLDAAMTSAKPIVGEHTARCAKGKHTEECGHRR